MAKTYIILESYTPQGQSIKKFLKKNQSDKVLISNKNSWADTLDTQIIIPTGANSTFKLISEQGEIKIGDIQFNKKSLIVYDKLKTIEIVKNLNIPVPDTTTDIEEIKQFPVFYKNKQETSEKLRGIAATLSELPPIRKKSLLFQELINHEQTVGVGFIASKGKVLATFSQREIISHPISGGTGIIIEAFDNDTIENYTKRILDKIKYSGWGLAEYKFCPKRQDYVFMEINGKFWASFEYALKCNPIFGKLLFQIEAENHSWHRVFFVNHFIKAGFKPFLKTIPFFLSSKILWRQKLIYYFFKRFTGKLKRIFHIAD